MPPPGTFPVCWSSYRFFAKRLRARPSSPVPRRSIDAGSGTTPTGVTSWVPVNDPDDPIASLMISRPISENGPTPRTTGKSRDWLWNEVVVLFEGTTITGVGATVAPGQTLLL